MGPSRYLVWSLLGLGVASGDRPFADYCGDECANSCDAAQRIKAAPIIFSVGDR